MEKNLLAMQQTQVQSLGREDPLEKGMAIVQYYCLENSWTEEPGRLQSIGLQRIGQNWETNTHNNLYNIKFNYLVFEIWEFWTAKNSR